MRRPQFTLKTLLWLMGTIALALGFYRPVLTWLREPAVGYSVRYGNVEEIRYGDRKKWIYLRPGPNP
jgi:hypothetical protein